MIASMILMTFTLTSVVQGSLFHPSTEYSQRTSRPTTFAVSLPLYQRIAAVFNSNGPSHPDGTGCVLNHPQDPDQGDVVQSASYPQVAVYHPNYQQSQWAPVVYNPAVTYNQPVPYNHPIVYNAPVPYPQAVAINRVRAVQRLPLGYPVPTLPLDGVPSVNYGYHHPSPYSQPIY